VVRRSKIPSSADKRSVASLALIPTFDLKTALAANEATIRYAIRVWETSSSTQSLARRALGWLAYDAVCLHQAILFLGLEGWAFATPILARSMLDLSLSVQVIVNASQPDVAAFEYLYAFAKDGLYQSSPEARQAIAAVCDRELAQMNPTDRKEAEAFLASQRLGPTGIVNGSENPGRLSRNMELRLCVRHGSSCVPQRTVGSSA